MASVLPVCLGDSVTAKLGDRVIDIWVCTYMYRYIDKHTIFTYDKKCLYISLICHIDYTYICCVEFLYNLQLVYINAVLMMVQGELRQAESDPKWQLRDGRP